MSIIESNSSAIKSLPSPLSRYEWIDTIGSGSFGRVSRLRRRKDGFLVASKEIYYGKMSEREKQQQVTEVNLLREFRNPFILRYYERCVDKKSEKLYIITEFCGGGDLGKKIYQYKRENKYIPEKEIWRILAQALVALRDCHRRNENGQCKPVLHRDLKPANILLDNHGNIKMGDFGLAKEIISSSSSSSSSPSSGLGKTKGIGTPYYMAPEIVNDKNYDEKSDMWSLGCLIYELASLRPPFDAPNIMQLAAKITSGKYTKIPSHYSESLSQVISMLLEVDPARRPNVDDLNGSSIPALASAMYAAVLSAAEYKLRYEHKEKMKALLAKEEEVNQKALQLDAREADLVKREEMVEAKIKEINGKQASALSSKTCSTVSAPTLGGFHIHQDSFLPPPPPTSHPINPLKAKLSSEESLLGRRMYTGAENAKENQPYPLDLKPAPVFGSEKNIKHAERVVGPSPLKRFRREGIYMEGVDYI